MPIVVRLLCGPTGGRQLKPQPHKEFLVLDAVRHARRIFAGYAGLPDCSERVENGPADDFSGVSIEPSSGKTWRPLHALKGSVRQRWRRHRSFLLTDGRDDEDQASAASWSNIETAVNPSMSVPPGCPPSACWGVLHAANIEVRAKRWRAAPSRGNANGDGSGHSRRMPPPQPLTTGPRKQYVL